jgi:hypothetical protein
VPQMLKEFIHGLFNDAVGNSDYAVLNDVMISE